MMRCCTSDEGRPFRTALRGEVLNQHIRQLATCKSALPEDQHTADRGYPSAAQATPSPRSGAPVIGIANQATRMLLDSRVNDMVRWKALDRWELCRCRSQAPSYDDCPHTGLLSISLSMSTA